MPLVTAFTAALAAARMLGPGDAPLHIGGRARGKPSIAGARRDLAQLPRAHDHAGGNMMRLTTPGPVRSAAIKPDTWMEDAMGGAADGVQLARWRVGRHGLGELMGCCCATAQHTLRGTLIACLR